MGAEAGVVMHARGSVLDLKVRPAVFCCLEGCPEPASMTSPLCPPHLTQLRFGELGAEEQRRAFEHGERGRP